MCAHVHVCVCVCVRMCLCVCVHVSEHVQFQLKTIIPVRLMTESKCVCVCPDMYRTSVKHSILVRLMAKIEYFVVLCHSQGSRCLLEICVNQRETYVFCINGTKNAYSIA